MVFGGWGRKNKSRGEVFFVCTRCSALNPFGLVENYSYGQLYGVWIAKYDTNRLLLCAHCQDGWELDKEQWKTAMLHAKSLEQRGYELDMREMAESAVELAEGIFPDTADEIRLLLWEQLGEEPPAGIDQAETEAAQQLESGDPAVKTCPDCAEEVKSAARICRFCGYEFPSPTPMVGSDAYR